MSRKNRRKRSKGFGSPAQPETARSQPKYSIRDFEKSEIEPLAYRVTPAIEKAAKECASKYRLGVVFQPEGHDVMMFSRPTGDRFIDAHLSAAPNAKLSTKGIYWARAFLIVCCMVVPRDCQSHGRACGTCSK